MDAIQARSQHQMERPARQQIARGTASPLGQLLHAALERLILRQLDVPSEFFRYPLP